MRGVRRSCETFARNSRWAFCAFSKRSAVSPKVSESSSSSAQKPFGSAGRKLPAAISFAEAAICATGFSNRLEMPHASTNPKSRDRAEKLGLRLDHARPESRIREQRMRALKLEESLQREVKRKLEDSRHKLALLAEQFRGLSPLAKLSQGYSFVEDKEGRAIRRVSQVHRGDELTVNVTDGQIYVKVRDKRQKERENAVGREIC